MIFDFLCNVLQDILIKSTFLSPSIYKLDFFFGRIVCITSLTLSPMINH